MQTTSTGPAPLRSGAVEGPPQVVHFRQSLLWPLRLVRADGDARGQHTVEQILAMLGADSPWREHADEFAGGPDDFHARHYQEFVSFLPYVQQFLYGEGRSAGRGAVRPGDAVHGRDSPMQILRRRDITALRAVARAGDAPITLQVAHIDLYFFFDVDIVLLNVELAADQLSLVQAQELLYRLGRAYPAGWDASGAALHGLFDAQWLDAQGRVVAQSDAQQPAPFLTHVAQHRTPRIAADWAHLLRPLVSEHSDEAGALRVRLIETYRMPVMGYLALDDPGRLTREDFVRLGWVSGAGSHDSASPYSAQQLEQFEANNCYDHFWHAGGAAPHTRYLCNGDALVVVGDARAPFFTCAERGVLAQFRHQHFLLFLIAHFQRATLLMFSEHLVEALKRLDIRSMESVKRFKRAIRASFERLLRFTHRYWFHEISQQSHVKALWHLCARHLDLDPLYDEVRVRINDMNDYLDADSLRRQASTVVRLTVVTLFGLVGTITTGFLGMNLLAEAEAPLWRKGIWFVLVFCATTWLTTYTMMKSKRLSDFIDALSDDRQTWRGKLAVFRRVWRAGSD